MKTQYKRDLWLGIFWFVEGMAAIIIYMSISRIILIGTIIKIMFLTACMFCLSMIVPRLGSFFLSILFIKYQEVSGTEGFTNLIDAEVEEVTGDHMEADLTIVVD